MRKRRHIFLLTGVILWGGFFLFAHAQDQRPRNRERIRDNIHRLRLLRMTEALGLNEEQTAKIYPLATRIENEKRELLREISGEMSRLRDLLAESAPAEDALSDCVSRINGLRQEFQEKDREFEDSLDGLLSPLQKAKYILFSAEFYRGIVEGLGRRGPRVTDKQPF